MKFFLITFVILFGLMACSNQGPYDESADAKADINQALQQAKLANLPLVVIFGANWCPDCRALSTALETGKNATKIAKEFKIVKVNVGNFDENLDITAAYGNPIQGGIPGAIVLTSQNKVAYMTKPGELATARNKGDDGIYILLKKMTGSL